MTPAGDETGNAKHIQRTERTELTGHAELTDHTEKTESEARKEHQTWTPS
ncbi:hypothetical protein [Streptomyces sp. TS71-3]|nr:hypothetical protein [Streptomyces sp. TS71-3]GHJ40053.1 hypothetical protein Sm713_56620 [Streptomyces sp. TS71-3]